MLDFRQRFFPQATPITPREGGGPSGTPPEGEPSEQAVQRIQKELEKQMRVRTP